MLDLNLLNGEIFGYELTYIPFFSLLSKAHSEILIHFYTLKMGHIKCTMNLCQNLLPQLATLRNTYSTSKPQNSINSQKIHLQAI